MISPETGAALAVSGAAMGRLATAVVGAAGAVVGWGAAVGGAAGAVVGAGAPGLQAARKTSATAADNKRGAIGIGR